MGFAGTKYRESAVFFSGRRFGSFFDDVAVAREIEGIEAKLAIFGVGQVDTDAVAVHDAPDVGGDFAQHIAQVEIRNHAIGEIEQEFEPLLRLLRGAEIHGVVHRERNLIGHQFAESHFIGRISCLRRMLAMTRLPKRRWAVVRGSAQTDCKPALRM